MNVLDDLWYKNAIIYCLDVEKYLDSNGDGIGDFASPNRDNGYDVTEYYGVNPKHGTLGEFVDFMNHAEQLGIRVIVDLVVNHTSNRHPWFQSARQNPRSPYYDWYVWSKKRPRGHDKGMVFPGVQKTTWTRDPKAKQFYFHRFHDFQPDLVCTDRACGIGRPRASCPAPRASSRRRPSFTSLPMAARTTPTPRTSLSSRAIPWGWALHGSGAG